MDTWRHQAEELDRQISELMAETCKTEAEAYRRAVIVADLQRRANRLRDSINVHDCAGA